MSNAKAQRFWRLVIWMFAVVVLLGLLTLYITFYAVDGPSLEQGRDRAGGLLVALEEYKQAAGSYPPDLDRLVPEYLSTVPRPAWRYEYYYKVCSSGMGYILYFRQAGDADNYCGYSSKAKAWRCDDSMPPYYYAEDSPCYQE